MRPAARPQSRRAVPAFSCLLAVAVLASPAPAVDDGAREARRAPATEWDYLREVAPWLFTRVSSTTETQVRVEPLMALPTEPVSAQVMPAPIGASHLAITPGEALLVRMNAGLAPPSVSRATVIAAGFEPTEIVLPTFAEVPGGIVFGVPASWPEGHEPRGLAIDAAGNLVATFADGTTLPFAAARADDLLACLEQARATRGSDALVSIVRGGRIQLSAPFATSRAGAVLVRADLAPFAHVEQSLAQKSLVVDLAARIVRGANGELVPLADLEVRFYRVRVDEGEDESAVFARAGRPARLLRTLTFTARATPGGELGLDFAEQQPAFWRLPPPGAIAGLERDLAPAARLAAWTALFRDADERGWADLDALARALAPHAARAATPSLAPPRPR